LGRAGSEDYRDREHEDAAGQAPMSWKQRVVGLIVSPARTFASLTDDPDIITPLVGITLSSLILGAATVPYALAGIMKLLPADVASTMPAGVPLTLGIVGVVMSTIQALFVWLVAALLVRFVATIATGRGTSRAALSTLGFAMFPSMVQNVLRAAQVFFTGQVSGGWGLAALFPGVTSPLLRVALSTADVFTIWGAVLMVFAVAATFRLSRARSVMVMSVFWALSLAVQVAVFAATTGVPVI
jgi:hypothetical protein